MVSALRHLSYANVMATVAVFLALGGGAYAVSLPNGSVKSRHIGKGQVKRSDIARGAVNSVKVADASLLAEDFKPGQIPAGPKGDPGPAGDPGPPGERGPSAAFASSRAAVAIAESPNWTTVTSLVVPGPGTYVINAKLEASTNGSRSVRCELGIQFAPGPFALRDHTRTDVKGEVQVAGVALQDTATVAQGVFYEVRCRRSVAGTDDVVVDATKLTAIQVGSINP